MRYADHLRHYRTLLGKLLNLFGFRMRIYLRKLLRR